MTFLNNKRKVGHNRIYRKGRVLKTVIRAFLWSIFGLLVFCVAAFFILKSWTVYDSNGAHIVFPWSHTTDAHSAERINPPVGVISLMFEIRSEAGNGIS